MKEMLCEFRIVARALHSISQTEFIEKRKGDFIKREINESIDHRNQKKNLIH